MKLFAARKLKMDIEFNNFAKAGSGTININRLTVICGPNNSGKTYINYAIFSVLENINNHFDIGMEDSRIEAIIDKLKSQNSLEVEITKEVSNISGQISKLEAKLVEELPNDFADYENNFSNVRIRLKFEYLDSDKKFIRSGKVPGPDASLTNAGNNFSFKYFSDKNLKKIEIFSNQLNRKASFFDLEKSEQIEDFKFIINQTLYRNVLGENILLPFPICSERAGISQFYKHLDKWEADISGLDEKHPKKCVFPLPVRKNIDLVLEYEHFYRNCSFFTEKPKRYQGIIKLLSKLLDDKTFKLNDGLLTYGLQEDSESGETETPFHMASSSAKSLFLMDMFIRHIARDNHILIIDEPEQNLFPDNQVKMARLVAKLVNSGLKVLVTTQSDFFIREINNLLTLNNVASNNKFKDEVMKLYEFEEDEILKSEHVSAYMTTVQQTIEPIEVNKFGIDTELLDSIIQKENNKARDVSLLVEDEE